MQEVLQRSGNCKHHIKWNDMIGLGNHVAMFNTDGYSYSRASQTIHKVMVTMLGNRE